MVILDLCVTIDELLAASCSVVKIYANEDLVATLSGESKEYSCRRVLAEKKNHIVVKREYLKPTPQKGGLIKYIIANAVATIVMAGTMNEPFSCLLECEEDFEINCQGDSSKLVINCVLGSNHPTPSFLRYVEGCSVQSSRSVAMAAEELKDSYDERRRLAVAPLITISVLLVPAFLCSVIFKNMVTAVFVAIIYCLIVGCVGFSLRELRKQYLKMLN